METLGKIILGVFIVLGAFALIAAISLLMAFPVMWCWNYALVTTFGLPKITWGVAWCLIFLAQTFLKSNISTNKS